MVKKRMSKKASSSSHKTKKHITHTEPAVEQLDVTPVIQQQAAIQTSPIVEQQIHAEPAPIFIDDTSKTPEKYVRQVDESNILKIFGIALCCIVMLFWIGLAILSTEINTGPKIITQNVSVTTYVPTPISLAKFMNITDVKYSEKILQTGYLLEEKTDRDLIKKYITDDKGNKVELILRGISQGEQYNNLFVTGKTTQSIYNVTGTFRFEINRFIIEVNTITPETKTLKEVSVWSMENTTTDDVRGVTINIARGVNKIVTFI